MALYLAFDFGLKRIGLASGQSVTGTATPLGSVKADNGTPDWDELEKLVSEWQPDGLVVGLPLNMDGTEQPMTARARKFAKRLHGRTHLPYYLVDERLSSREAREQTGFYQQSDRHDGQLDAAAACVILDQFLESL